MLTWKIKFKYPNTTTSRRLFRYIYVVFIDIMYRYPSKKTYDVVTGRLMTKYPFLLDADGGSVSYASYIIKVIMLLLSIELWLVKHLDLSNRYRKIKFNSQGRC